MFSQKLPSSLIRKMRIMRSWNLSAITFCLIVAGFTYVYAEELKDTRTLVKLPSDIEQKMIVIMRDHIRALEDIIYAIQVEDYDEAEQIVESRLGWSSSLSPEEQEVTKHWPEAMQKMGKNLYHAANDYIDVSQNAKAKYSKESSEKVIAALGKVINACRSCHETYRFR